MTDFIVLVSSQDYAKTASALGIVSKVMYALAAVCLAFALYSFIVFKIPAVIGDLTGRTAKKSIEKMRRENETSGKKSFRPTAAAMERGTITTPVNESKKESKRLSKSTNKVQTSKSAPTATAQKSTAGSNATVSLGYDSDATEVLQGNSPAHSNANGTEATEILPDKKPAQEYAQNATEILTETISAPAYSQETVQLSYDTLATQKLEYDDGGTEVLTDGTQVLSQADLNRALHETAVKMKMVQDIVLIHTEEII